jgi:hypothetical protein
LPLSLAINTDAYERLVSLMVALNEALAFSLRNLPNPTVALTSELLRGPDETSIARRVMMLDARAWDHGCTLPFLNVAHVDPKGPPQA